MFWLEWAIYCPVSPCTEPASMGKTTGGLVARSPIFPPEAHIGVCFSFLFTGGLQFRDTRLLCGKVSTVNGKVQFSPFSSAFGCCPFTDHTAAIENLVSLSTFEGSSNRGQPDLLRLFYSYLLLIEGWL